MKKDVLLVLSLLLVLMTLVGCIGNSLRRTVSYDKNGDVLTSKLEINNLKGMVNTSTGSLAFDINDGDFQARLLIVDSNVIADPNSAIALGQMVKIGSSNFTPAGTVESVLKSTAITTVTDSNSN
jgi:hypothetical protein